MKEIKISRCACHGLALLLAFAIGSLPAVATDWTHWRGPGQNGVSPDTGLISSWSVEGENLLWRADFTGRSTPVVIDGRVCANGRGGTEKIDRQEIVACWDAKTGRQLWEHRFNVYNTTVPYNRVGWASLAADPQTGWIYALGVAGNLFAFDRDGGVAWSRFLTEEVGFLSGYGGRTQTPLIDGDQMLLSFVSSNWGADAAPRHRYYSFDKSTGALNWISSPGDFPYDMNTQSVPVVAEIGGKKLLISGNADGKVYALKAATGEMVWSFALGKRGLNSSVIVDGNRVFASHSEENLDDSIQGRMVCIDGTGSGDVTATHEIWRHNALTSGFPSPTLHDGHLYVVDNSANLYSLNADTGETEWEHSIGTVGKGSPVWADGKLFVTEVNGRFHILQPGEAGVKVLDEEFISMPDGRYAEIYGSPAIADGRVFFSTENGLFALGDAKAKQTGGKVKQGKKDKQGKAAQSSSSAPAWLQVVPAESLLLPSQTQPFGVRTFDAAGRPVADGEVQWSLVGLAGKVDASGTFVPDPSKEFQAGTIVAKSGALQSSAMVRVIGKPPWSEDFEAYEAGDVPGHWVGAKGKYVIEEQDGNKVLAKKFRAKGLLRNATYFGPSTWNNYTIEADVQGGQKGRRKTDCGLIAGGYTLDLMGNSRRVQLRSWPSEERMAQEVPFEWAKGVWYRMKLTVDVDKDKALIRGKVWPRAQAEPEEWTIRVEDPHPIQGGSPGLVGYSPADIYYDNINITVNP